MVRTMIMVVVIMAAAIWEVIWVEVIWEDFRHQERKKDHERLLLLIVASVSSGLWSHKYWRINKFILLSTEHHHWKGCTIVISPLSQSQQTPNLALSTHF